MVMLMQVLNSCASKVVYIYDVPDFAKPKFPDPWPVVFVDEYKYEVTDEETEIEGVYIPYWYWNEIIKYKIENDVIYETLHPG